MSKLYLIPTPIGNLEDITLRAIRILKEVDLILAEDTRTSGFLLKHYGIQTKLSSFHKFNEHVAVERIVEQLKNGTVIALISDAGTPGISDPGFLLVRACRENEIPIECLPGPTALIPALVQSGFPTDRFSFEGFLPHKKGRQTKWKWIANEDRTVILYESPHRLLKALTEATEFLEPGRKLCVCRELSKMFEETIVGTAPELLQHFTAKAVKGEIVLIVEGKMK